jgi:hypothetical protein
MKLCGYFGRWAAGSANFRAEACRSFRESSVILPLSPEFIDFSSVIHREPYFQEKENHIRHLFPPFFLL